MPWPRNLPRTVSGLLAAALIASACGAQSAARDMGPARITFQDYVAQCSARHGYSPAAGSALGPYILGTNEREWRECVYQGIEQYLIPSSLTPEIYRRAIAEDRKLTDGVSAGKVTRGQRAAQILEIISEIERVEEANQAKIAQMQSVDRLVKEEMMRQQDPIRRVIMVPLAR